MKYLTFTLSLLVLPTTGSAHHSRAEFADDVQEIEGEIVEIAWRNPHPVLTVSATNAAGEEELWEVESWSSANALARTGGSLPAGTIITTGAAAVMQPTGYKAGDPVVAKFEGIGELTLNIAADSKL